MEQEIPNKIDEKFIQSIVGEPPEHLIKKVIELASKKTQRRGEPGEGG